ncbi:MAG: hypothetical protein M1133_11155 [Armatimonadetes bacterium]|nr:hypothetical protein [Armatimonadota bacterium]
MSNTTALTIIATCQLIMTAAGVVAVGGLIYAIFAFKGMISSKIDEALSKVQPVIDRAESVAEQAKETAEHVSGKVDAIMAKAEETADTVGDKVQSVSTKVEEAMNPQVVAVAGVVGTAVRCLQLYSDIVKARRPGNGPHEPEVGQKM